MHIHTMAMPDSRKRIRCRSVVQSPWNMRSNSRSFSSIGVLPGRRYVFQTVMALGYTVIVIVNCTRIRIQAHTPKVATGMMGDIIIRRNAIAVVADVIAIAPATFPYTCVMRVCKELDVSYPVRFQASVKMNTSSAPVPSSKKIANM